MSAQVSSRKEQNVLERVFEDISIKREHGTVTYCDGVDVAGVADEVRAELARGEIPDLHDLVPACTEAETVNNRQKHESVTLRRMTFCLKAQTVSVNYKVTRCGEEHRYSARSRNQPFITASLEPLR